MSRSMKFNDEERKGIFAVGQVITKELKWIFREALKPDIGVDAYIEACEFKVPTGKTLALQIKSGKSYFLETNSEGVFYRGDIKHLEYWKNHSIPVLLVLHNPKDSQCYWQVLDNQYIFTNKKTWKIFLPFYQKFDYKNRNVLISIASNYEKYTYNLKNVICFREIMIDLIKRKSWTIYVVTEPGFERRKGIPHYVSLYFLRKSIPAFNPYEHEHDYCFSFTIFGSSRLFESVQKILPWADITYEDSSGNEAEEVLKHIEDLKHYEWYSKFEQGIKTDLNNDLAKIALPELGSYVDFGLYYKATIKINDFGYSFLTVDRHLNSCILNWGDEIST